MQLNAEYFANIGVPPGGFPPRPLEFREAVDYYRRKGILPTTLTHDEMAELNAQLRERALWSAQVQSAEMMQGIADELDDLIATGIEPSLGGPEPEIDEQGSPRMRLTELAESLGVDELTNEGRMNLILRTQSDMAYGYGDFKQATSEGALMAFPCWELLRVESRVKPRRSTDGQEDRFWQERWEDNGGELYDGRMIAKKEDPIWVAISDFGLPHDPLAFNTGYRRLDVPYDEAVALGVIEADEESKPPKDPGAGDESMQASPDIRDAELREALEAEGFEFDDEGVLT